MLTRIVFGLLFAVLTSSGYAQSPMRESPASGPLPLNQPQQKEDIQLKADALQFAINQRNAAMDSLLACQASGTQQVEQLKQKNSELLKRVADLEQKAQHEAPH